MADLVHIDGSLGEGGGQILRTSLSLSAVTGRPLLIDNIRANRSKPGLRPQHLKAVEAAAAAAQASVSGASLGSGRLTFKPGELRPAEYRVDIGTAGAASLVLQTVFLPLSLAQGTSKFTVTGGTHVPWSPCFHYLDWHWLPAMRSMGYEARFVLDMAGFYPQGGGVVRSVIEPANPRPLRRVDRGSLRSIRGLSALSNLPGHILRRQRDQAMRRLEGLNVPVEIEMLQMPARSKGTLLLLLAQFERSQACYFSLGARGKPAERVADEAVDALERFLGGEGAVDEYLADQLLLPMALSGGNSQLTTVKVTQHLRTNAATIQAFLPVAIKIEGELDGPGSISVVA